MFVARFGALCPESRKEWTAETEIARAGLAMANGDRRAADCALMAALSSAEGTRIAERVKNRVARLRAFGNGGGYAQDALEALRLQAEYAARLARAGDRAENERTDFGRRLVAFWTETVDSSGPPFDGLAQLFARDTEAGAAFGSAAADLLGALELIEAPWNVGADLAERLLEDGGAGLDAARLEWVLSRYVGAGLERAVAAGLMGNAQFARREFACMAEKLRAHQPALDAAVRRLFPRDVIDGLLRFGKDRGPPVV
ncbi:MAG TPA: hypothetical protein VF632_18840 [Longimicrobium sp.]